MVNVIVNVMVNVMVNIMVNVMVNIMYIVDKKKTHVIMNNYIKINE